MKISVFCFFKVIRPETCTPCGKRIRFGKIAVKCRDCRVVSHPDCKHLFVEKCSPTAHGSAQPNEVFDFHTARPHVL